MKKTAAFLTALIMCAGTFSCGKKSEKPTDQTLTTEKMYDVAYKKEYIAVPGDIKQVYTFDSYSGGERYFICGAGATVPEFWTTDLEFTDCDPVEIPDFNYGYNYGLTVTDGGKVVTFCIMADYGDLPDPDPTSPDYDDALYRRNAEYSYAVRTYTVDGKFLEENAITGFGEPLESTFITDVSAIEDFFIAEVDNEYQLFGMDGTYVGALTAGENETIETIGTDGTDLLCAVDMGDEKMQLRKVNTANATLEPSSTTYTMPEDIFDKIIPGQGDYSLYLRSYTTVYGVKSDGTGIEPLFNTSKSAHAAHDINGYGRDSEGNFIIVTNDNESYSVSVERLREIDPEELANIPVLTIGFEFESYYMPTIINTAERGLQDYRVNTKIYRTNQSSADDSYMDEIAQDALAGELPDILIMDNSYQFGRLDMHQKEALCDLYEFMDNDPDFGRDKFIPNVLAGFEDGGGLYSIPHKFSVDIGYTCKTKYAPEGDFNIVAMMNMLDSKPETMIGFNEYSRDTRWHRLWMAPYRTWIDFDNLTCRFDSQEFVDYLEFCNRADDEESDALYPEGRTGDPSDEEMNRALTFELRSIMDETSLFYEQGIGNYNFYLNMKGGVFAGEPFTILGTPDYSSSHIRLQGAEPFIGITATSENKEMAWDFLKRMLSDECYATRFDWAGFPPTVSGLAAQEEHERQPQSYGDLPDYDGYVFWAGYKDDGTTDLMKIGYVDDEIVDEVNELINTAEPVERGTSGFSSFDDSNDFYTIFLEETDKYFAGEYTAQQCAEILQSRLSIFVAERCG